MRMLFPMLLVLAGLAWASERGVPLNRADLDAVELYREVSSQCKSERNLLWKAREDRYPSEICAFCDRGLADRPGFSVNVGDLALRICGPRCQEGLKEMDDGQRLQLAEDLRDSVIERDLKDYPLAECPVNGTALDSIQDPLRIVYDWTLIQLSDSSALREFRRDPKGYALTLRLAWQLRMANALGKKVGG